MLITPVHSRSDRIHADVCMVTVKDVYWLQSPLHVVTSPSSVYVTDNIFVVTAVSMWLSYWH